MGTADVYERELRLCVPVNDYAKALAMMNKMHADWIQEGQELEGAPGENTTKMYIRINTAKVMAIHRQEAEKQAAAVEREAMIAGKTVTQTRR